jgi:hypothetical protein
MSKHSPAPWKIRADGAYIESDTRPVCDIRPTNPFKQGNAQLISAAPDLLEACKILLGAVEDESLVSADDLKRARAAVDKAEGVQAPSPKK